MAYTDLLSTKAPKLSLMAVCVVLLLFSLVSSYSAFNPYAQQGGAATDGGATGGAATGGQGIGGAPCYGSTCNYYNYGGPATGGQATGGAATDNGVPPASPSPLTNQYFLQHR